MKTRLQRQPPSAPEADSASPRPVRGTTAVQAAPEATSLAPALAPAVQVSRAEQFGHSLRNFTVQPALAIGEPGDKYEQEADTIAHQAVQRQPAPGGEAGQGQPAPLDLQARVKPTPVQRQSVQRQPVQRQPDMDLGGAMPDMGGGDLSGMTDAMGGGGGDLGGIADAMGGGGSDLGGMADAMGGGGSDLGGIADAMGGGGSDLGGMADAMGGGAEGLGEMTGGGEAPAGEMGDAPAVPEVTEMLEGSGLDAGTGEGGIEESIRRQMAGGEPLPEDMQGLLRSRLGMENPEEIRIHDNAEAHDLCDQLGALAFTTGNHIFFAAGEYDPDSPEGQELIFHEAVHTVQQGAIASGDAATEPPETPALEVGMKAGDAHRDRAIAPTQTVPLQAEANPQEETDGTSSATQNDSATQGSQTSTESTDNSTDNSAATDVAATTEDVTATDASSDSDASGDTPSEGSEEVHTDTPPSDVVGETQDIFKPVDTPEPAPVTAPDSLGDTLEPTENVDWEDGLGSAEDAAGETFDELGGEDAMPSDFNSALAQGFVFAGPDAGDLLNLQLWSTGDDVGLPEKMSESDFGNAWYDDVGEWVVDNVFLAGTTGKITDIANTFVGDQSVFALKPAHPAHAFGYLAILGELFIKVLELITGILDLISLTLVVVMMLCIGLSAMFTGLATLLAATGNPVGAATMTGWAAWWTSAWQAIAAWLVTLSQVIAYFTLIRLLARGIVITFWLLDALVAGVLLGWKYAEASLGRAAVQAIGAVADIVSLAAFKFTGGGFGDDAAAIAAQTGSKSFGSGALTVASRDASETVGEAVFEEVLIGAIIAGGAGAGLESGQSATDDATRAQAQVDEAALAEARESSTTFDEEYTALSADYETAQEELPPLPDEDPLAEVEAGTAGLAICDAEDERAAAAITATERLIVAKQLWAERMYEGQMLLATHHAQQEQSQALSESYREKSDLAAAAISDAQPAMEEFSDQTDAAAGDLQDQQGNIQGGAEFGNAAGQEVPVAEAGVAQQESDAGAQDMAQGPGTGDQGLAMTGKAAASQDAQAQQSEAIQGDIENAQGQFDATQAMNQEELAGLTDQYAMLLDYRTAIAAEREEQMAAREAGLDDSESWSEEVFALVQAFLEAQVADSAEGDQADNHDDEEVDEEDAPSAEELAATDTEAREFLTLEEALSHFRESWQAMAEELSGAEGESFEEDREEVLAIDPMA